MCSAVLNFPVTTFKKHESHHSIQTDDCSKFGLKVTPFIIDFGILLKSTKNKANEVVPGIPNLELLHATATLYGVSLSEVTDDVIYPIITGQWSRTILIILDEKQAEEKTKKSLMSFQSKTINSNIPTVYDKTSSLYERKVQSKNSASHNFFANVFSDNESNASDEDEIDYIKGIDYFLYQVDERRKARQRWLEIHGSNLSVNAVDDNKAPPLGIENRLIGCATFERSYDRPSEKVFLLSLLAVRHKFRGFGIGSFMIRKILDPNVTGELDVLVVNAAMNSVDFFEKLGFTDDVMLNSRYAHIGDVWFNSKRMCYLKEYMKNQNAFFSADNSKFNLKETEMELIQWKERNAKLYQSHASIIQQMRNEILTLHAHLGSQDQTISQLEIDLSNFNKSQTSLQEENFKKFANTAQFEPNLSNQNAALLNSQATIDLHSKTSVSFLTATTGHQSNKMSEHHYRDNDKLNNLQIRNSSKLQTNILGNSVLSQIHHPSVSADDEIGEVLFQKQSKVTTDSDAPPVNINVQPLSPIPARLRNQPSNNLSAIKAQEDVQSSNEQILKKSSTKIKMYKSSTAKSHSQIQQCNLHKPSEATTTCIDIQPSNVKMLESNISQKHDQSSSVHMCKPHETTMHVNDRLSNIKSYKSASRKSFLPSSSSIAKTHVDDQPSNVHLERQCSLSTEPSYQSNSLCMHQSSATEKQINDQSNQLLTHDSFVSKARIDFQPTKESVERLSSLSVHNDDESNKLQKQNSLTSKLKNQLSKIHMYSSSMKKLHQLSDEKINQPSCATANKQEKFEVKPDEKKSYLPTATQKLSDHEEYKKHSSHKSIANHHRREKKVDSDVQDIASTKHLYPDIVENEFLNFIGQSTDEFCSFAKNYSETFENFAKKSNNEFRSFVKQSSDEFRNFLLKEIEHCFLISINEEGSNIPSDKTEVVDVIPAELSNQTISQYNEAVSHSHDPDIVVNLYFCGGEHHRSNNDSFNRIIRNGFAFEDFVESNFGNGLHFTRHASSAAYFSPNGHILVARVCLGSNKTLTKKDSRRKQAPEGYDSVLTQGRLSDSRYNFHDTGVVEASEYIIFNHKLAVPIAIIKYKVLQ